jgi:enoyl-CoA hydratase
VILTGAGAKAFVAGADISEFTAVNPAEAVAMARKGQEIFFRIERNNKPIVAAVNGFALGGGCELAMCCHFRTASLAAKFGQPEVNLGLLPGYGGTQRLVQLVGKGRAMEWLMTGKLIDANEAMASGLVNHVWEADQLLPKTREILLQIHTKAPRAIDACIEAANYAYESDTKGYQIEAELFGRCFSTEDSKEGIAAFLEKRKPQFKGK